MTNKDARTPASSQDEQPIANAVCDTTNGCAKKRAMVHVLLQAFEAEHDIRDTPLAIGEMQLGHRGPVRRDLQHVAATILKCVEVHRL